MWSSCALIVGMDGIDSPFDAACPITRREVVRQQNSDEERSKCRRHNERRSASKGKAISSGVSARLGSRINFRIFC